MEIVVISDSKMKQMALGAMLGATKIGYNVSLYKPDKIDYDLSRGETINGITYEPKSQWKPYTLRNIYNKQSKPFVYMDADTLIVKPLEIDWDFDIGITMKRDNEKFLDDFSHVSGHLNAGVIFINKTEGAKRFLDLWCNEMPKTRSGSDQEALTRLVLKGVDGISIKKFTTDEYNYYYFNEPIPENTKVLHFKGGFKKLWKIYANVKN